MHKKNHKCHKFTDSEMLQLYLLSKSKFNDMKENEKDYNEKYHRKWADNHNYGFTHFGVDPRWFLYSKIRFDVFHLIFQITRKHIETLRRYVRRHEMSVLIELCNKVLCKEWSEFAISVFATNKPLSLYKGKHISSFIQMIPEICKYMKENFVETLYCNNLIEALKLWITISTFIKRAKIYSNKDDEVLKKEKIQLYVNDMDKFNDWVERFYSYGNNTFMISVKNGDSEPFYLHTLRFYMPDIIRDTW